MSEFKFKTRVPFSSNARVRRSIPEEKKCSQASATHIDPCTCRDRQVNKHSRGEMAASPGDHPRQGSSKLPLKEISVSSLRRDKALRPLTTRGFSDGQRPTFGPSSVLASPLLPTPLQPPKPKDDPGSDPLDPVDTTEHSGPKRCPRLVWNLEPAPSASNVKRTWSRTMGDSSSHSNARGRARRGA